MKGTERMKSCVNPLKYPVHLRWWGKDQTQVIGSLLCVCVCVCVCSCVWLCPLTVVIEKERISVILMEKVEKTKWEVFLICVARKKKRGDRQTEEGDLSWHGLVFLSFWCYSGLFHGEGFLNISVCVWMAVPARFLSASFTAVNTASSFELSTSVCACACTRAF